MVLPLGGDVPGMGPSLERLQPRLKRIKACLVTLVLALVAKLTGQLLLQPWLAVNIMVDSLDAVLVAFVGVFLLKDDPLFGKVHACLVSTCCSGCEEQCSGGAPCLCTWFAVCLITALSNLLEDVSTVYVGCRLIFDPSFEDKIRWNFPVRSAAWSACMVIYLIGVLAALGSQILGAWQGMKGFVESQEGLLEPMNEADWTGERPFGLRGTQPQPSLPEEAGGAAAVGPQQQQQRGAQGLPPRGWEPFSGQGQRLTD